jgi:hypothetical protein
MSGKVTPPACVHSIPSLLSTSKMSSMAALAALRSRERGAPCDEAYRVHLPFRSIAQRSADRSSSLMRAPVLWLHADAPAKPAPGQACNGCGVCCAAAPCPLGIWASRRLVGPCAQLLWDVDRRRYVCGALSQASGWRRALAQRWIAAGKGCDCSLDVAAAGTADTA